MKVSKERIYFVALWGAALLLASCSAYYSVFGLSQLFAGASLAVIFMASVLEAGKLITVSFLHRFWGKIPKILKLYLTGGVAVLMIITSAGVYGFLSNAYQITASKLSVVDSEIQLLETQKGIFQTQADALLLDKENIRSHIETLSSIRVGQQNVLTSIYADTSGRRSSSNTRQSIKETDKDIQMQFVKIDSINAQYKVLLDSISTYDRKIVDAQNTDISAELGPLIYLSRLTGVKMDYIINWFILMIVIVFDPMAVSLVIASGIIGKKMHNEPITEAEGLENPVVDDTFTEINTISDTDDAKGDVAIEPEPDVKIVSYATSHNDDTGHDENNSVDAVSDTLDQPESNDTDVTELQKDAFYGDKKKDVSTKFGVQAISFNRKGE